MAKANGKGATGLVEALKVNSTLGWLDLTFNNVGKMVVSELRRLGHDGRIFRLFCQSQRFETDWPAPVRSDTDSDFDSDWDCK